MAKQEQIQAADRFATPISLLAQTVASVAGMQNPKPEWWNPYGKVLYIQQAKEQVPVDAARTFMELYEEGKVPSWVLLAVKVDLIRAAAT